jgi:hypothetical protein
VAQSEPPATRYEQTAPSPVAAPPRVDVDGALGERIRALESEVASLRADLEELRDVVTAPAAH